MLQVLEAAGTDGLLGRLQRVAVEVNDPLGRLYPLALVQEGHLLHLLLLCRKVRAGPLLLLLVLFLLDLFQPCDQVPYVVLVFLNGA